MPPRPDEPVATSSYGIKYPKQRDVHLKSAETWLEDKRHDDGAEGLWRIHDDLYDLREFIKKHPGGPDWLILSKGTDITEAFEVHHLTTAAELLLPKYHVRKAKSKRDSPFTFKDDGFYRTLKRNVRPLLRNASKQSIRTSAFLTDAVLVGTFVFGIMAAAYWNYLLAIFSGMCLCWTTIAAHNYFHRKDNFRMYYFNFSMMQMWEWRVSHVLSHHLLTNTIKDMEISFLEPAVQYLPIEKSSFVKYGSLFYVLLIWLTLFHMTFIKKIVHSIVNKTSENLCPSDLLPFSLPLAMYVLGGQSFLATLWMWTCIVAFGSFHFGFIGFNAAHHHPDIFHDGDAPRPEHERDWGISQLDAVMDRHSITGSHWLVLTNFGDHALHHLFPTLDHGILESLYPTFYETMKQFNLNLRFASQMELIKGQFIQLTRTTPNPNPPDLHKTYK